MPYNPFSYFPPFTTRWYIAILLLMCLVYIAISLLNACFAHHQPARPKPTRRTESTIPHIPTVKPTPRVTPKPTVAPLPNITPRPAADPVPPVVTPKPKVSVTTVTPGPTQPQIRITNRPHHLQGPIYILSIFVSSSHRHWNRSEVSEVEQQVQAAEHWIIEQTARYGCHDVSFVNGSIGNCRNGYTTVFKDHPQPTDSFETKVSFAASNLAVIGYPPLYQYADQLCRRYGCRQFHILIFSKLSGVSHAYFPSTVNGRPFSLAVIYRHCHGELTQVGVIAHEMLHLFYAYDLYRRRGFSQEKEDYVRRHYPHSIMLCDESSSLDSFEIDPFTAWTLGLAPKLPDFDWLYNPAA